MVKAPVPADENERLKALKELHLNTLPEERFDRITRLATRLFKTPMSTITLIDSDKEWFKSAQGMPFREGDRSISFCGHAILTDGIFLIPDAALDPRFADNPMVVGPPYIRFYAGIALKSPSGQRVGTFCIRDRQPRQLTPEEKETLKDLAAWAELELNTYNLGQVALTLEAEKIKDEAFLNSIGEGVTTTDSTGVATSINKAGLELLGFKEPEVIGKTWAKDVPSVEDEKGNKIPYEKLPVYRALHNQGVFKEKHWYRGKNGVATPVIITAAPVVVNNKNQGAIVIFTDLTEQEKIDKLKDEFLSIASHELRTPMSAVKGSVSMILDGDFGPVPEKIKAPLRDVQSSTEKLIGLVSEMLNISRIESGRLKLNLIETNLLELIENAVENLRPIAAGKGIGLSTGDLSKTQVLADGEKVSQILNNLLGNALKFTDQGSVEIFSEEVGEKVKVSVKDTGVGITKSDQEKLFGKFQQINTEKGRPEGTGLGLYISRELAKVMGGDLRLENSEPGKGSTFALTLPKAK